MTSRRSARKAKPALRATADAAAVKLSDALRKSGVNPKRLERFGEVDGQPIYRLFGDGAEAIALWEKLRGLVEETGYWPVVMGSGSGPWEISDLASSEKIAAGWAKGLKHLTGRTYDKKLGVTEMILSAGRDLKAEQWLRKHRGEEPTTEDDLWAEPAEKSGKKLPKSKANTRFRCVYDVLSDKPLKDVAVALWPTSQGWQVPALMRYGGWNSCPAPHEQVCVLRYWQEKYLAELVAVAGDVVELRVGRPPRTDAGALELARAQYSFCDDIVSQGTMTLERLAACLKNATVWYFWWD